MCCTHFDHENGINESSESELSQRDEQTLEEGKYKGFKSPVSGVRVKDQVLEQRMFLMQGFQEPCARNRGQRPMYTF